MANISQYINAIQNAVYGEEVRASIINALNKVNDDNESYQAIKNEIIHSKDEIEAVMNVFDSKVNDAKELTKKIQELSTNADSSKVALDEAIKKAEGLELLIDIDNVNKVKAELDNAVAKATTTKQELESADFNVQSTITQATTTKNDLDAVITTATSIKNELNNTISSGNELKTALTTVVNNATSVKNELETIVNNVATVKNELNTLISNGNELKTDLQSEFNKSTTALNDLKKENASAVKNLADLQNANFNPTEIKNDIKANEDDIFLIKSEMGMLEANVIGIQVDYENQTVTRLVDAKGLNAGSDFNKFNMYGGRKRCNLSDDGIVSAWYGDSNYKEDGSNGQVMVFQPKFYYKVLPLKTERIIGSPNGQSCVRLLKANYYISDNELKGFKLHPAFEDKNGFISSGVYIGAYEGSLYDVSVGKYLMNDEQVGDFTPTTGDKLCSIAGVKPMIGNTQSVTPLTAEIIAKNRGNNWHLEDVKILAMNQLLMMVEYASLEFSAYGENKLGKGVINADNVVITGGTSSLGNSSSNYKTNEPDKSISYRGMENPFGNVFELIGGASFAKDKYGELFLKESGYNYIWDDDLENTPTVYDEYVSCGFYLPNESSENNHFTKMVYNEVTDWFIFSEEVSQDAYMHDDSYLYLRPNFIRNVNALLLHGGHYNKPFGCGMFTEYVLENNHNYITSGRCPYGCRLIFAY